MTPEPPERPSRPDRPDRPQYRNPRERDLYNKARGDALKDIQEIALESDTYEEFRAALLEKVYEYVN